MKDSRICSKLSATCSKFMEATQAFAPAVEKCRKFIECPKNGRIPVRNPNAASWCQVAEAVQNGFDISKKDECCRCVAYLAAKKAHFANYGINEKN